MNNTKSLAMQLSVQKQILECYKTNNEKNIRKLIKSRPINIIINILNAEEDIEVVKYVLFASRNIKMGQIFMFLNFDKKVEILETSKNVLIKKIFSELEVDDIYDFVMEIEPELFKKIIISIDPNVRKQLFQLSKYEDGEIGSIMNTQFFKCYEDWTISKTIKEISNEIDQNDFDKFIYVMDSENKLVGKMFIYNILLEKKRSKKIKDLMDKSVLSVSTDAVIEDVIQLFQKYERESIPVVNKEDILVGIVTDNDILPEIQDEMTEDIYKMYGISMPKKSYIRTNIWEIFNSRILWLIILMTVSTLTSIAIEQLTEWSNDFLGGSVIGGSLSTLLLVPIIPVISGTSGNAGSQSAASVIRSLSTGEIEKKDYKKVMFKEMQVALLIGFALAIFNFIRLLIYYAIFFPPERLAELKINWSGVATISAGISLCLFISISLSKIVGGFLPIMAIKMKIDPTAMASPMLTTLIDTVTTTILFTIGTGIIYLVVN